MYSPKTTKRLEALSLKMFEGKITEIELEEYRILGNELEEQSLIRLENLMESAKLKNTILRELMIQHRITKVYAPFEKGSLRDKKRLQKRFLSLKNHTRIAAGNAHYFLLEVENL